MISLLFHWMKLRKSIATYPTSLILLFSCIIATLIPHLFRRTLFSHEENPLIIFSFTPQIWGESMRLSHYVWPLVHQSGEHLALNTLGLLPILLILEKKFNSLKLARILVLTQGFFMILFISFFNFFSSQVLKNHQVLYFLGSSHLIFALYTYWFLNERKFKTLIFFSITFGVTYFYTSAWTFWGHFAGSLSGIGSYYLEKLGCRARTKPDSSTIIQ
jgi:membrane associated rhomboid family serine protease